MQSLFLIFKNKHLNKGLSVSKNFTLKSHHSMIIISIKFYKVISMKHSKPILRASYFSITFQNSETREMRALLQNSAGPHPPCKFENGTGLCLACYSTL